ncbi:MAG: DUF4340 domain-containing protein [Chloroflexi bacterium]|nr:DUF4340 domain-containing protein [Chloroflexota bacterium]
MNVRLTFAVVALFLALGGFIYFYEISGPGGVTPTPRQSGPRLLTVEAQTISGFEATFEGQTTVVVRGSDGRWRTEQPTPGPADEERLDDLARRVAAMRAERVIGERLADLKPFGLDPPQVVARITTTTGQRIELHVGNETLTGGAYFVKLANDTVVYTVSTFTAGRLKGLVLEPPRAATPTPGDGSAPPATEQPGPATPGPR